VAVGASAELAGVHAVADAVAVGGGTGGGSGAADALGFPGGADAGAVDGDGACGGAEDGGDGFALADDESADDAETGEDGIGTNTVRFVSKSGRVVIEDYDHWLARTVHFGYGRVPDGFFATWKTYVRGVDQVSAGTQPPSSPHPGWITLANGLSETTHRLVLTTKPGSEFPLRQLRVKSPAGKASISVITPPHPPAPGELVVRTVTGQTLLIWTLDPAWVLKSSASLDSKATWKDVPAARIRTGTSSRFLLLSDSDATSFYRLVRVGTSN
jgi:hypothetical protein